MSTFDLRNMNCLQEMPSIKIDKPLQRRPTVEDRCINRDLDIKGQQISEIPKNTMTNKDFDRMIDNLDEKFQLFSDRSQ